MPGSGRARWGWYRLADDVACEMVVRSGVGPASLVLDLGAGDGAITRHLVRTGARVIAFELHADRAAALRSTFAGDSVKIVRADVADLRLPARGYHVVANPPFGAASAVLDRITSRHSRLVRADMVLPVALARRWEQRLWRGNSAWSIAIERRLPRTAFTPRPRVDCCLVTIRQVS